MVTFLAVQQRTPEAGQADNPGIHDASSHRSAFSRHTASLAALLKDYFDDNFRSTSAAGFDYRKQFQQLTRFYRLQHLGRAQEAPDRRWLCNPDAGSGWSDSSSPRGPGHSGDSIDWNR
jgi:hypothetical protein